VTITPGSGAACVAGAGPAGIAVGPLAGAGAVGVAGFTRVLAGAAAALVAVVPLGAGACGVLVQRPGRPAEVFQTAAGSAGAAITALPAGLVPLAMFRCHQHLLVIAASGPAGDESAALVPVPLTRGPFAAAAAVRSIPTTGCS
jgi:hypothetical protein